MRPGPREISALYLHPILPPAGAATAPLSRRRGRRCSLLPDYLERLCGEIRLYGDARQRPALRRSVYVGGGTPAVLSAVQIRTLLQTARRALPMDSVQEFTFEAGRPDAVDAEKLRVLRGVRRRPRQRQSADAATRRWRASAAGIRPRSFTRRMNRRRAWASAVSIRT